MLRHTVAHTRLTGTQMGFSTRVPDRRSAKPTARPRRTLSASALRLAHIYAGTGPHLPCTVVITLRIHIDGRPLLLTPAALPALCDVGLRIVPRASALCGRVHAPACNASCRNAWLALLCRREAR